MPTGLFAGLCLLGSATRLLDSSCAQQAPCERRLWAQMSTVRVVCKIPGAHLGRPRILMWPGRTCQHVGVEEARPKDNTNNDNNDLYAGLASMLVQRCRAPGYSRRQVQCNLPAQVQGGCPCAMDAALLDGAPLALACRPGQQAGQSQPLRRRSPLGQLNAGEEDRHRGIVVSSASLLFQAPAIAGTSEASASWHKLAQAGTTDFAG
ncbi:unnamed protein product [Polarella glacialis]|uniref:Uncharacterized protein n=1 Tax=Polarella glacialis TaxID=89957 RepID=A0A813G0F2_POLGL|nr:unnamed protein product [Polarella glacialis]